MKHVLIIQAVWDGSIAQVIVHVYPADRVVEAFARLRDLRENGHVEHEGANFEIDMFGVEAADEGVDHG